MIPYGAFRPDVGGPNSGTAEAISGAVPQAAPGGLGYGPFPQLVTASGAEALSGEPRGVISGQMADGSWQTYAATGTTIEKLSSTYQWDDVETGRTVTADADVSMLRFGSFLLNTDTTSGLKAYNVETPAGNNAVSGAPAARAIFQCNNTVFALTGRRVQSSAVGDHTAWTGEGTDGKTFEDGGDCICGRDLKNGTALIAQERALRIVQFGQGAGLYSIAKLADERGCVADRTMVAIDGAAFWWDTDGPWQFSMGSGLSPIGAEKINRWAETNIGSSNYGSLWGTVDPARNIVIWRVDSAMLLVYNWVVKEWSLLPAATSVVTRLATPAVTIDGLSGTIDAQDYAIDSRFLSGGAPQLAALDTSYKFATFSGSAMAATLRGSRLNSPLTGLYRWATPIDDCADGTLAIGTSDTLDGAVTWRTGAAKVRGGRVPLHARGMNIQFERVIPAGSTWTFANGIDHLDGSRGGPK